MSPNTQTPTSDQQLIATHDAPLLATRLLAQLQPGRTLLPSSLDYETARRGYWSQDQADARPACFFCPETAAEVALAVIVLQHARCPFAIKSGGHGRFMGESSINKGITIDLKNLNHIKLAADKTSVEIGPGNTWLDVYSALEPLGLSVVGGRAAGVGVGGFILGGGISFMSNKYGWATDNVEEFEVVLADGRVVTANQSHNADLYKALRGGGANMGIVTSFKLTVRPQALMWGGGRYYAFEHGEALLTAFWDYGHDDHSNVDMSFIMTLLHQEDQWIWGSDLMYLHPEAPWKRKIFKDIFEIPTVLDNTIVATQSSRVIDMGSHFPDGIRNAFWTFCTKVDKRIVRYYFDTWKAETNAIVKTPGNKLLLADCQFITGKVVKAMERNGGNSLGLSGTGPFLMMLMQPWWADGSDTPAIMVALKNTAAKVQAEARRLGVEHNYVYLNYSGQYQDPFTGYGAEAKEDLRATAMKYDPTGVFQKLRKSGFNLQGAFSRFATVESL